MRLPPRPTLFPYTTLFRSLAARKVNGIGPKAAARLAVLGIGTIGELARADRELLLREFGESYGAWMHEAAHGREDRKSTRLNSSHLGISYAVFCLKKKTKK